MYCYSILANSEKWSICRKNIYSIFILLLSYYKTDQARLHFERLTCKIKELGKAENSNNYWIDDDNLHLENTEFKHNLLLDFESTHEEKYYQQFKGSMYYQDCLEHFKNSRKKSKIRNTGLQKNDLYFPQFKITYGIPGDEYNVKFFGASKSLWHHYWLAKVRLRIFDDFIWSLNKMDMHLHKMVRRILIPHLFAVKLDRILPK